MGGVALVIHAGQKDKVQSSDGAQAESCAGMNEEVKERRRC